MRFSERTTAGAVVRSRPRSTISSKGMPPQSRSVAIEPDESKPRPVGVAAVERN
jgi:hypothetical protein